MFTQKETRLAVEKIHNRWHPQIVVDLHEMRADGARIFVPPYTDPIDPNVDPILQGKIIELGSALFSTLISSGRRGVPDQCRLRCLHSGSSLPPLSRRCAHSLRGGESKNWQPL